MTVLDAIRNKGFEIRPTTDGIYISPIDALEENQRVWLVENKPLIRSALIAERWQWFLSLATEHGIHPYVVGAEFPSEQDRLDLLEPLEHDDTTLYACMEKLCADARVKQRQSEYESGRWVPVNTHTNETQNNCA